MRREIKGFGTIVSVILSEICEDPTYARFTVSVNYYLTLWTFIPTIAYSDYVYPILIEHNTTSL